MYCRRKQIKDHQYKHFIIGESYNQPKSPLTSLDKLGYDWVGQATTNQQE